MGRIFTVGVEILKSNRTGHPAFTAADRTVRMELKMSLKNENGRSLAAEIYKNTKMGADSITDLIGHVKDGELRLEMTAELDRYEELASRAAKLTREKGEEPKEEGALTRAAAKMSSANKQAQALILLMPFLLMHPGKHNIQPGIFPPHFSIAAACV